MNDIRALGHTSQRAYRRGKLSRITRRSHVGARTYRVRFFSSFRSNSFVWSTHPLAQTLDKALSSPSGWCEDEIRRESRDGEASGSRRPRRGAHTSQHVSGSVQKSQREEASKRSKIGEGSEAARRAPGPAKRSSMAPVAWRSRAGAPRDSIVPRARLQGLDRRRAQSAVRLDSGRTGHNRQQAAVVTSSGAGGAARPPHTGAKSRAGKKSLTASVQSLIVRNS